MISLLFIGLVISAIIYLIYKQKYEKLIISNKLNIPFIRLEKIKDILVNIISIKVCNHLMDIKNIYLIVIFQKQMVRQLK